MILLVSNGNNNDDKSNISKVLMTLIHHNKVS